MEENDMEYVTLNNGIKMPKLGYGVYLTAPRECERCVLDAVSVGYRLIDTACICGGESAVGSAIRKCGVPRKDLFITARVGISNAGYEKAKASIDRSLEELKTDYIDLLLIHQPFGDYYGAYRAMEEAYKIGYVKAVGVSDFCPERLIDICRFSEIPPQVDRIETNVFRRRAEAHKYMEKYGVVHMSQSSLAGGKNDIFNNPVLTEIGKKYGKTAAQTALRSLIASGVVAVPKSVRKERMEQNFGVFDFDLTEEDMSAIAALDEDRDGGFSQCVPQTAEDFIAM